MTFNINITELQNIFNCINDCMYVKDLEIGCKCFVDKLMKC